MIEAHDSYFSYLGGRHDRYFLKVVHRHDCTLYFCTVLLENALRPRENKRGEAERGYVKRVKLSNKVTDGRSANRSVSNLTAKIH